MATNALAVTYPRGQSSRGRPSAERAAEIDEAIRSAALGAFLSSGYEATSMDAITAAAKVSKGTLYSRYPSKEVLFRSLLEDQLKKLSDRAGAEDHLLPAGLEQRLRVHARTLIASMHFGEFERVQKLMASARLAFPQLEQLWHELAIKRYVEFLAQDMANCANVPQDTEVDWLFLANLFLHSIGGWQHAERLIRPVSDEEVIAFSDAVIATILRSIPQPG
jgi:TetR/AcrR family transcriptional regulator, mexJK operon transcriptional repressor